MSVGVKPRRLEPTKRSGMRFSICTLVTNHCDYSEMVRSFQAGGFDQPDCEYLYVDNSEGNAFDAFEGGNAFLRDALGDFIILCHQDVTLLDDNRQTLEDRIAELDIIDDKWAVCGNAGGTAQGELVIRISDPHGMDQKCGSFPARVTALDENFLVVRREANLVLSHDLSGFHLYGADLCILADVLGCSSWVIDFHLEHKSPGRADASFHTSESALWDKYRRAFRSRPITTTCTNFRLPGRVSYPLLDLLFRR